MPISALPSSTFDGMSDVLWNNTVTPGKAGISAVYLRKFGLCMLIPQDRRNVSVGSYKAPSLGIARRKFALDFTINLISH